MGGLVKKIAIASGCLDCVKDQVLGTGVVESCIA